MGKRVNKTLIKLDRFSFDIGKKTILDSISLSVNEGEYFSLIGPNGAGKTTLLKCLMRILTGGRGSITLNNKPLSNYSQKELARLMSYVPQSDGRSLPFTVEEFVMMGRYPYLSPFTSISKEDKQAVKDAVDLTGIAHLVERRLDTLSGGERQTVYIASALTQGSRIVLLDEPTTFLDPKHESDILGIIKKINREYGITIISVTHDINSAVLHSDRIAIIKNGKIIFVGNAGDVLNNNILDEVYEKAFFYISHPVTGTRIIIPAAEET